MKRDRSMKSIKLLATLVALSVSAAATLASERELICFGNEPSWRLDLPGGGEARFSLPDGQSMRFRGSQSRIESRKESVWRGRGRDVRELVAFLKDGACSDGMSETVHPVSINLSLPDGRYYAGCCRAPATPAPAATLEGANWRLLTLPGQTVPGGNGAPTARFEGGRVSGFSGCNRFMGNYTVDRDKLSVGTLAGSMMACPEPVMALEKTFLSALSGTLTSSVAGNRLSLTPVAGGKVIQFELEPKPVLEGVEWEVTAYNNGRQAVVSPQLGTRLTIAFKDGLVSGSGGCNSFHGPFKAEGNAISIGPLATTRKWCSEKGVMAQEQEFIATLETATTWEISRGMLDVHRKEGERVLTASNMGK
jgi:heat shock protein HslJ